MLQLIGILVKNKFCCLFKWSAESGTLTLSLGHTGDRNDHHDSKETRKNCNISHFSVCTTSSWDVATKEWAFSLQRENRTCMCYLTLRLPFIFQQIIIKYHRNDITLGSTVTIGSLAHKSIHEHNLSAWKLVKMCFSAFLGVWRLCTPPRPIRQECN